MKGRGSVSVRIEGREYVIRSDADREAVERAAVWVDETMAKIRARTRRVDSLDVAVLAALNIANQAVALRDDQTLFEARGSGGDAARVRALIGLVESALRPEAPPAASS